MQVIVLVAVVTKWFSFELMVGSVNSLVIVLLDQLLLDPS